MDQTLCRTEEYKEIISTINPCAYLCGKRILCTGGTGFLFRYFLEFLFWLNRQYHLEMSFLVTCRKSSIKIPDDKTYGSDVTWLECDLANIVLDPQSHVDIIIHAASPANKNELLKTDTYGVIHPNVIATQHLLEIAKLARAQFLYISSGEVYPKMLEPIAEDAVLKSHLGRNYYGTCKRMGELICEHYITACSLNVQIVRPFSIFGPGESRNSGRYFVEFISRVASHQPIELQSDGSQIRSHCYVSDFVTALLHILLYGESTAYNVGNDDSILSIKACAERINSLGAGLGVICHKPTDGNLLEDCYIPDTTKLRMLGWHPVVGIDDCIIRLLRSYKE